ncbi:MAG TPA: RNA polymerase sigma factor [Rhizomicrobium sp.]|nr:RNA polymerase sigma factor [Rhizomicrobium sp.]
MADHEHEDLDRWFAREILPLEPMLNRFLRRKWRDEAEISDLRQEAYIRVYDAARRNRPLLAKPFLFLTVRNLMIDKLRQKSIVSIETMADFGWSNVSDDKPSPEQNTAARQELRLLQGALDELPERCRQIVVLRKVEGLSQREVAGRLGVTEDIVEHQLAKGLRLLARSLSSGRRPITMMAKSYLALKRLKD